MFNQPISQFVWETKYRYQQGEVLIDQSIQDTWQRVAAAIAMAETPATRAHWQQAFYSILEGFKFLPGGRILAGAGTKHEVTLFNCFVMNIPEDSIKGIFEALGEGALTLQQGGGVGYDFSVLRPFGDEAKSGVPASGPVSFMRVWDSMCAVLLSTGSRRGAMMGVLRCDHPDIEAFITAKRDPRELRHFNVSVMVTDEFMQAVKDDADWALVFPVGTDISLETNLVYRQWGQSREPQACKIYRTVRARDLWQMIIFSAYDYAEPGVLFSDTINHFNNLWYCERINATNPCGEIPLPPYGACDLGAINLTQFVTSAFTSKAAINWRELENTVQIATRFLDNVIDVSRYPLKAQQEQAHGTRRIGLGVTGFADCLIMLGIQYGSEASLKFARELMQRIANVTWDVSIDLAKEKNAFPFFTKDYVSGAFVRTLPPELIAKLIKNGVRNSHHNTIAPAGTISLLANNISNGIEPVFRAEYQRHVRLLAGTQTFMVRDYAQQLWQTEHKDGLPPAWIDTESLSPEAHLQVLGAMQPYIDNAISKTINLPHDFPFEQLAHVYTEAHALGLKGCTIFRPNPITGSVLETPEERCCQFEDVSRPNT